MKKLFAILTVLVLMFTFALAEENKQEAGMIVDADAPAYIVLKDTAISGIGSISVSFDANMTTGYEWTAFILAGDSVAVNEELSGYVTDPNPEGMTGVGGKAQFVLNALQEGESLIRFNYARNWENEPIREVILWVTVDEDLFLYVTDVTVSGTYDGVVTAVNEEDHSVTLSTEKLGEVIARFDEGEALPVQDEHILIYTNGTMTMSLPAIVNVIAWSSVPSDAARE